MREFEGFIFPNGRIVAIPEEEYMAAIEAGKEILVFCGGWAGGYATGVGLMPVLKSNKLRACNGEPYDWLEIWNDEVDDLEPLLIITANGCL